MWTSSGGISLPPMNCQHIEARDGKHQCSDLGVHRVHGPPRGPLLRSCMCRAIPISEMVSSRAECGKGGVFIFLPLPSLSCQPHVLLASLHNLLSHHRFLPYRRFFLHYRSYLPLFLHYRLSFRPSFLPYFTSLPFVRLPSYYFLLSVHLLLPSLLSFASLFWSASSSLCIIPFFLTSSLPFFLPSSSSLCLSSGGSRQVRN